MRRDQGQVSSRLCRCDQLRGYRRLAARPLGLLALPTVNNSRDADSTESTAVVPAVINSHEVNLLDSEALPCSL